MDEEYPGLAVDNLQVGQVKVGIYAPTAEILKDYLQSVTVNGMSVEEWCKKHPENKDCYFLMITLECGCEKHFEHLKDIPLKSIKCKHGNYFIRIGDEKE